MRALEFRTRIKNNQIQIPFKVQSELKIDNDKDVRVIVLFEDAEIYDDHTFQNITGEQFFKGYADSDAIYDNY